jgi:hypothetical protein
LSGWYDTVRVTAGGATLPVDRENGRVRVRLSAPDSVATLRFELNGEPGRSGDEERDVVGSQDLFLLWSDRFYPVEWEDWATVRTTIVLPAGFEAIAPGRRTAVRQVEGGVAHVFETTHPTISFSVFADARWTRTERIVNGVPMQTLLHPQSQQFAERIFATSAEVLAFYRELHGGFPFDGFALITQEGTYARRAYPGFVGYEPGYLDREMGRTGHDAHETALLWWGYTTRGSGPGSWQWTEGLGDYVEILFDEATGRAHPASFERFRAAYLETPVAEEPPYTALRGNTPQKIVHGKYPWLMHALRYVVGDTAFRAGLRLLFDRYRFRTFTMEEMVATLGEGAGQSLAWWREEWVERPGVPEIVLEWAWRAEGTGYRVTGRLRQTANLYRIPLEIGLVTATGTRVERVTMAGRETEFSFRSDAVPTDMVVDPRRWLLLRVTRVVSPGAGQ